MGIYTISKKKNAYVGKVSLPLSFLADRAHVDKWYNVKVKTSNWEKSSEVKKGDFAPQLRLRLDFEEQLPEAVRTSKYGKSKILCKTVSLLNYDFLIWKWLLKI